MSRKCAVTGCLTNSTSINFNTVRFFTFPHNERIRQKWINACNNPKLNLISSVICDLHFDVNDYQSDKRYLLKTAIPKTILSEPLIENPLIESALNKSNSVEFLEIPASSEYDEIENISVPNGKLYNDSSVQCNLFEEKFYEEIQNYTNDYKLSIDEIMKMLGIGEKNAELKYLQEDFSKELDLNLNEQTDSDISNKELSCDDSEDIFTVSDTVKKKRKPPRDISKQNFILLPNNAGYQCEVCSKKCLNLAAYYAHRDSHLEQSTICTKCGWNSSTYKLALYHERLCVGQITNAKEKKFPNKKFNTDKRDTNCEICNYKFGKYVTYMDHMNVHNNIKPYMCSCLRKYSHYSNFLQHVIKYKCPIEGRIVPDYAPQGQAPQPTEIQEKNMEKQNNKKRFYCPICDSYYFREKFMKHFSESQHLANEKLWIKKFNVDKYPCAYCNISITFDKLLDLINHCRKIHHKTPNNQFFTMLENKSIQNDNDNSLFENIKNHSKDKYKNLNHNSLIPSDQKYCPICDKYFVKRITYLDHMNIHDSTYPYICCCGVKLRFYEEFLRHIRRNRCKGKIIFPDYAPQTFAKYYNSKQEIDEDNSNSETVLDNNFEININEIEKIDVDDDDIDIKIVNNGIDYLF